MVEGLGSNTNQLVSDALFKSKKGQENKWLNVQSITSI
jgi:hypothetical protein